MSAFSEYLVRCREAAGLSQSQVAQRVRKQVGEEVAAWYVNKVERGKLIHPAVNRLKGICEAVGADFDEALRLGEYPGYNTSEARPHPLPPFLRARLAGLTDEEIQELDRLWPIFEDLIRAKSVTIEAPRRLKAASSRAKYKTRSESA